MSQFANFTEESISFRFVTKLCSNSASLGFVRPVSLDGDLRQIVKAIKSKTTNRKVKTIASNGLRMENFIKKISIKTALVWPLIKLFKCIKATLKRSWKVELEK